MIWMKSYIMERERFDGADVIHLLFSCAAQIDWTHLLMRFGPDWRVLLSHLILFGYIYPSEKDRLPPSIMEELLSRLRSEEPEAESICRGTLLSRAQYLTDVREGVFAMRGSNRAPELRLHHFSTTCGMSRLLCHHALSTLFLFVSLSLGLAAPLANFHCA